MRLSSLRRFAGRLRHDRSGLALLEFAFAAPVVLGIGMYGIEMSNLALANLRMSQIALNLADNASRVGQLNSLSVEQLREVDINDVLTAAQKQGARWGLTKNGRITLSSLEKVQQTYDSSKVQRIHWQRCIGALGTAANDGYDSSYGTAQATDGSDATATNQGKATPKGMGDSGSEVNAPDGSGVMFVELNYNYQPVISTYWLPGGAARLHYIASYVVRDHRDFSQLFNPAPQVPTSQVMTCNKHLSAIPAS